MSPFACPNCIPHVAACVSRIGPRIKEEIVIFKMLWLYLLDIFSAVTVKKLLLSHNYQFGVIRTKSIETIKAKVAFNPNYSLV
jgi:hypothetical protein